MIKRLFFIIIGFFLIWLVLENYKEYQQLNSLNEEYLKEKDKLNKEIVLLKEIAINLEKFRLFFEPLYLEEIKKLIVKSEILKDNTFTLLINNLDNLANKPKKSDFTVFSNFRAFLAQKEKDFKNSLNNLETNYKRIKNKRKEKIFRNNIIIGGGLIIFLFLVNIFLPFKKKREKIFNNYFSLLELLKIAKEKSDKYLEKIADWENKIKTLNKSLQSSEYSSAWEDVNNYRKNFTYCLLNFQLGLLQKDSVLINKYFTTFQQMGEKILNLFTQNKNEQLVNYFKESEEELSAFKEDLINLSKTIGEIKDYQIKNDRRKR